MRAIVSICVVVLIFFGLASWTQSMLVNTADEMTERLDLIEDAVLNEEWEKASNEIASVQEQWEDIKRKWQMLVDHREIDNIDSTLVRTKSWIDLQSRDDCIAELSALRLFVLHIPEREALRITNIF